MGRGRTTAQLLGAVLALFWWAGLVVLPVQLLLALARAGGAISPTFADANRSVRVLGQVPGTADGWATFAVELSRLPAASAAVVALLQVGAAVVWLPVVRQLRDVVRRVPAEPFDHSVARTMRRTGLLVALAGAATSVLGSTGSWVAATAGPVPGASAEITVQAAWWALVAAAVCVLFAEVVHRGTVLREDNELTV